MRVRIRHADDLTLVLERQHVAHVRSRPQLEVLLAPDVEERRNLPHRQLRQRHVVPWRVADDPGHARGRGVAIDAGRRLQCPRRTVTDARMIVVEDEYRRVAGIARTADTLIARAEVAGLDVLGHRWWKDLGPLPLPGPVLTMCGNDDPLLAERVPSLFPCRRGVGHAASWRSSCDTARLVKRPGNAEPEIVTAA